MGSAQVPTGFTCHAKTELRDAQDRLIFIDETRETPWWPKYDQERIRWCQRHRGEITPPGFREGRLHLANYIFLKIQLELGR